MSKDVTVDQILEVFNQIRSRKHGLLGSINFWALQGLIESSSDIAFDCLLKTILNHVNNIIWKRCDDDYKEWAMTNIAIAGITRDPADIQLARNHITSPSLLLDRPFEARFILELASITQGVKDIVSLRQRIRDNRLSGYHLVKALLLLHRVTENQKFIDAAYKTAEQVDDIRAWVAIYRNYPDRHKEARDAIDRLSDRSKINATNIAVAAITAGSEREMDRVREMAGYLEYNKGLLGRNKSHLKKFAVIAFVTKDPSDLEQAYLAANELEQYNSDEGAKAWMLITRILAGVEPI